MRDEEDDDGDEGIEGSVFRTPVVMIPMSYLLKEEHDTVIQLLERQKGDISPEDLMELVQEAEARGVDVELIMEVVLAFTFKTRI